MFITTSVMSEIEPLDDSQPRAARGSHAPAIELADGTVVRLGTSLDEGESDVEYLLFDDLVVPMIDELIRFATRLTSCRQMAKDVVQEALIRAMKNWDAWDAGDDPRLNVRRWLFTIVTNVFLNMHRDRKNQNAKTTNNVHRVRELTHSCESESPDAVSLGPIDDNLLCALDALAPERRRVILMHYVEDMTCVQIAEKLNVPRKTVESRLLRGREDLKKYMKRMGKLDGH